jgi:hypothetical protein
MSLDGGGSTNRSFMASGCDAMLLSAGAAWPLDANPEAKMDSHTPTQR